MILNELDPKEKLVLELRYGLLDQDNCTLHEIGGILNLSKSRIGQIESEALIKVKTKLAK